MKYNKKYFAISESTTATALLYLGFEYYKFTNENGVVYSFENSDEFHEARTELWELRKKYKKNKKY